VLRRSVRGQPVEGGALGDRVEQALLDDDRDVPKRYLSGAVTRADIR
jgi:hypothetical protein